MLALRLQLTVLMVLVVLTELSALSVLVEVFMQRVSGNGLIISEHDVRKFLRRVITRMAAGPNGISARVLKVYSKLLKVYKTIHTQKTE